MLRFLLIFCINLVVCDIDPEKFLLLFSEKERFISLTEFLSLKPKAVLPHDRQNNATIHNVFFLIEVEAEDPLVYQSFDFHYALCKYNFVFIPDAPIEGIPDAAQSYVLPLLGDNPLMVPFRMIFLLGNLELPDYTQWVMLISAETRFDPGRLLNFINAFDPNIPVMFSAMQQMLRASVDSESAAIDAGLLLSRSAFYKLQEDISDRECPLADGNDNSITYCSYFKSIPFVGVPHFHGTSLHNKFDVASAVSFKYNSNPVWIPEEISKAVLVPDSVSENECMKVANEISKPNFGVISTGQSLVLKSSMSFLNRPIERMFVSGRWRSAFTKAARSSSGRIDWFFTPIDPLTTFVNFDVARITLLPLTSNCHDPEFTFSTARSVPMAVCSIKNDGSVDSVPGIFLNRAAISAYLKCQAFVEHGIDAVLHRRCGVRFFHSFRMRPALSAMANTRGRPDSFLASWLMTAHVDNLDWLLAMTEGIRERRWFLNLSRQNYQNTQSDGGEITKERLDNWRQFIHGKGMHIPITLSAKSGWREFRKVSHMFRTEHWMPPFQRDGRTVLIGMNTAR